MNKRETIKTLQSDYRPDEKFLKYGAQALTGAELLAIILRSGSTEMTSVEMTASILKDELDNREDILRILDLSYDSLLKIKGIGKVKALQIKAVAELSGRIASSKARSAVNFNDPGTIADYYMEQLRHRKREVVVLLLLDSGCSLLKEIYLSEGTVNISLLSPRDVFIEAVRAEAVNIILLHNHPSGSPQPSRSDIESTELIYRGGNTLGIGLLDHIIIGDREYFSFREKGILHE